MSPHSGPSFTAIRSARAGKRKVAVARSVPLNASTGIVTVTLALPAVAVTTAGIRSRPRWSIVTVAVHVEPVCVWSTPRIARMRATS